MKKVRREWRRICFSAKFMTSPTILGLQLWPVQSPQEFNFFIKVIEIFSPKGKGQGHCNLLPVIAHQAIMQLPTCILI